MGEIVRLQKYIAMSGVASRRAAETMIQEGRVKVNGKKITEQGVKIEIGADNVSVDDKPIKLKNKKYYIMLNKPEGVITSVKDEKGRKTILDIVKVEERVYPIGRLDYDSSGLLLLTNDGDIYNNIIHPRVKIDKKYIAECKGVFSKEDMERFEKGLDIGGYVTAPAKIRIISEDLVKISYISTVEITIYEGKNRQIRKMCSSLNHEVISLKRVSIGDLKLGYLQQGKYRELTKEELQYIKEL